MTAAHSSSRPASLATRVTVFVGITTTICLIALGVLVQRSIEDHFLEQDASELQAVAETVREALASANGAAATRELQMQLEHAVAGHHAVFFMVADAVGNILYATPGAELADIAANQPKVQRIDSESVSTWNNNGTTYRGAVMDLNNIVSSPNPTPPNTLVVATSIDFHLEFMTSFYRTLWGVVIGISLFSIFAAWLAVHQGHSPLRQVSNQIRDTGSDQLHLRVDTTQVPIELVDLVSAFNEMLQRMEDVFNRLSNFSADIAHELRTPLTNIITQSQVSLNQVRTVDEYQELLYSNLEEFERMSVMINDMLMLAKTESGLLEPAFVSLDVETEIRDLFEFFEAWSEENQVRLELAGKCEDVLVDRSMFKRALSNLLTNAIRHSARNEVVRVLLESTGKRTSIVIENTGTPIAPEQIPKIFDRFYRGDPSRQRRGDGAGLGLAIVKSIAEVHGWAITATSSDGLTRFKLDIPGPGKATTKPGAAAQISQ